MAVGRNAFGLTALVLGLALLTASPTLARPAYALQQRDTGGDWAVLRVYGRKTGHTVWSRRCLGAYSLSWSQDRRSFAAVVKNIDGQPSYSGQFRLLYWRAGSAVCLVTHPALFEDFDEVINLRWSPDGRRFAFLGGSTAFDSGGPYTGSLCCVDAVTGHFFFGPNDVDHYRWVGSRRLKYVAIKNLPNPKPRPPGKGFVSAVERPRDWTGSVAGQEWEDPVWLRGKVRLHGRRRPW